YSEPTDYDADRAGQFYLRKLFVGRRRRALGIRDARDARTCRNVGCDPPLRFCDCTNDWTAPASLGGCGFCPACDRLPCAKKRGACAVEGIQAPQGHTRPAFARRPAWLAVPARKVSSVFGHYNAERVGLTVAYLRRMLPRNRLQVTRIGTLTTEYVVIKEER